MTYRQQKMQTIKAVIQGGTDGRISRQNFKAVITNMFKELKETKLKECFKSVITISHQIENINKELENF